MKTEKLLFAALLAVASAASAATTGAATLAVDFTEAHGSRFPAPAAIGYAPSWVAAAADTCDLLLVTHVGQEQCATQTLVSAASAAGIFSLAVPDDGSRAVRLILRGYSGGAVAGELVKDVSLAVVSAPTADGYYDTTDSKLDRVVQSGERPALVYSDTWAEGVASLAIDHDSGTGAFNAIFSANAPADGTYSFNPTAVKRTTGTVRLHFYDVGGNEIGEPLLASYAGIADMATVLFMR
ncbi:MAG: hypothetical protein ILM98_06145 [Kiritimatiellae bacterium]|nr:hypothetical protein [Kiritimatiellia bacterium]